MKILITGLTGFTGLYLKQELEQHGHQVVGLAADLTNWGAVEAEVCELQPDAVIHLAAISFVPAGESLDVYAVNTLGAQGLLEAFTRLACPPKKIILASSANVYGMREGIVDETMCPQPINHYGCSKLAMEHIAATYHEKLPIIISRPFNYTGIGQPDNFLIPKIVKHFVEKRPVIELGNIDVERDFSDVRWIAGGYRALLESGVPGECYNLCSGQVWSIETILRTLERITGHHLEVKVNPAFVRSNDIKHQGGNAEKLLALRTMPKAPDFSQTLQWMSQSIVGQGYTAS